MDAINVVTWHPREGMAGTFAHLVKAWGLPYEWPDAVRVVVCEKGLAPLRWDAYAPSAAHYALLGR